MENSSERSAASVRSVEMGVAAVIFLFGALVVFDSYRIGSRWGGDGPQAGYFPFYVGLLVCISAGVTFARAWRNSKLAEKSFVERSELKTILTVLVPSIVFVGLIEYLGLYVASILFIAYFMRRLGKYPWLVVGLVSVGIMVALFLTFEIWFAVPLPKGPLETALGLG